MLKEIWQFLESFVNVFIIRIKHWKMFTNNAKVYTWKFGCHQQIKPWSAICWYAVHFFLSFLIFRTRNSFVCFYCTWLCSLVLLLHYYLILLFYNFLKNFLPFIVFKLTHKTVKNKKAKNVFTKVFININSTGERFNCVCTHITRQSCTISNAVYRKLILCKL